ncbi:hypothetical protein [Allosphingosinicella indica]|nr:hypothetical protein [Allosphingosinicella indica]
MRIIAGLVAALLFGWLWHGPIGQGAGLIDRLEAEARTTVAAAEVPGISVALARAPLARAATLAGPADRFQRDGQGEFPGLTQRVAATPGIGSVAWADEPGSGGFVLPLIVEALGLVLAAYFAGLGIAWLLFGRPEKDGFLS